MSEEHDYDEVVDVNGNEDQELIDNPLFQALSGTEDGDAENEGDDVLDSLEAQEGDSEDVLRTKLQAKNKILRQRAKTTKRLVDKVEQLEAQLNSNTNNGLSKEDLADVIAAAKNTDSSPDEAREKAIEALREKAVEDPASLVDFMFSEQLNLENKIASILKSRDDYFMSQLESKTKPKVEVSPEIARVVQALKQQSKYQGLDEATLVEFAKDLAPLGAKISKRPPASMGGVASAKLPFDAKTEDVEKTYASELDKMGYGPEL